MCQKSDWAHVEKCCSILSRVFRSSSYEELTASSVKQLLTVDQWGNTPLHVLCFHKPPPSVIKAVLKAASRAPGRPLQVHTKVNEKGSTPLVVACKAGACRQAIHSLLHPPKGLLSGGAAVVISDSQGNTPFSGLVNRYNMIRKIPAYRKECLPLEEVKDLELEAIALEKPEDFSGILDTPMVLPDSMCEKMRSEYEVFPVFWNNVEELIQAAWSDTTHEETLHLRQQENASPLHAAAYVADGLPKKLTDLIFRLYSDKYLKESATLPLHLAVCRKSECGRLSQQTTEEVLQRQAYFIEKLLELDPAAADTVIPGTTRSTFWQAIVSGIHWNLSLHDQGRRGPLQSLFQYCPNVVQESDTQTGLYPFMLAAVSAEADVNEEDARCELDTIFNLLRLNPQSIQG
jgi:hypothetical protein